MPPSEARAVAVLRAALAGEGSWIATVGSAVESLLRRLLAEVPLAPPMPEVLGLASAAYAADLELAVAAAGGSEAAWRTILQNFRPTIGALISQFGFGRDREDLQQEIGLLLVQKLHLYRGEASLRTWIYRVALNHLRNYATRTHRKRLRELDESGLESADGEPLTLETLVASPAPSPADDLDREELRERVRAALAQVPVHYREAVILRDLQDLSYPEIALALEVPEATVRTRVARGRAQLARLLLPERDALAPGAD